ncbi:hypothetical protein ACN38_g10077 [Penicillium nordicum]|uniref:DUF6570 domain-containing protein n=1 Tax=Penicillium nordicum TaxID=229535 RepID=A0A0M8P242_9EURO|nr:hypothetical protein ACN38_g10077 [Penicillium nordicum]
MQPDEMPLMLPELTQVEEILISRVHVFIEVRLIRGQQYRYQGHVIHFLLYCCHSVSALLLPYSSIYLRATYVVHMRDHSKYDKLQLDILTIIDYHIGLYLSAFLVLHSFYNLAKEPVV